MFASIVELGKRIIAGLVEHAPIDIKGGRAEVASETLCGVVVVVVRIIIVGALRGKCTFRR